MTEPEKRPFDGFNPLADLKALTAQLNDEPSEDRHIGVLPLEWIAQEIFEGQVMQDDEVEAIVITFLAGESRPEAYHLLACRPCLDGLLAFAPLLRPPNISNQSDR